jgi:hypothetical protein
MPKKRKKNRDAQALRYKFKAAQPQDKVKLENKNWRYIATFLPHHEQIKLMQTSSNFYQLTVQARKECVDRMHDEIQHIHEFLEQLENVIDSRKCWDSPTEKCLTVTAIPLLILGTISLVYFIKYNSIAVNLENKLHNTIAYNNTVFNTTNMNSTYYDSARCSQLNNVHADICDDQEDNLVWMYQACVSLCRLELDIMPEFKLSIVGLVLEILGMCMAFVLVSSWCKGRNRFNEEPLIHYPPDVVESAREVLGGDIKNNAIIYAIKTAANEKIYEKERECKLLQPQDTILEIKEEDEQEKSAGINIADDKIANSMATRYKKRIDRNLFYLFSYCCRKNTINFANARTALLDEDELGGVELSRERNKPFSR